ncbi:conserved hypothetical protein [Oleispira antarctica RB-8]|uniref:DUF1449 domain-containing protein n=1 Tax=Oleispira antarctica RB-8 TaxID=698738 RepID=R4YV00_OLEAN|nr:conserved hypothetical protein [Oleispira antarctica RB-8]
MDPFYQNIASFPTLFFTLLLALTAVYWLVAVLGVIDLDVLDVDMPEGDADGGVHQLAGLLLKLGLNGVPLTIVISLLALFGWFICYFAVYLIFPYIPDGFLEYIVGLPILVGSLYGAVLITAQIIKPLKPLFANMNKNTVKNVLGQTAIVRSLRLDSGFGEVLLADGGAGLIFKARTMNNETFKKGDRVVLLQYLKDQHAYRVISEAEFLQ